MKQKIDKRLIRFYLYTGLGFLLLYSFGEYFAYPETFFRRVINSFFLVSYVTVLNYFLFERVLVLLRPASKQKLTGVLLLLPAMLFYSLGLYLWRMFWIRLGVYANYTPGLTFIRGVFTHTQFSVANLVFFSIVRNIYNNIRLRERNRQLVAEKKEAELNFLKSQTNPHFLFNTLNNIYSLARDKSDLAAESILRLSKILRFMLYEAGGELITIGDELKIITDYIALEKLRYDDSLRMEMNINIDNPKQLVPPLLLIPLVENAFKHGISETRVDPFLIIDISVKQNQLMFVIGNSMAEANGVQELEEHIGLSNLRRQLALRYKEYDLSVYQQDAVFTSTLKINLNSNV